MDLKRGIAAGIAAYLVWGASPIFWNAVKQVPPFEILAWRVVFALLLLAGVVLATRRTAVLRRVVTSPRTLGLALASGALLSINWTLFIWAVTNGRIVECSLGYYINPLMSVVLGVVVLRERLSRATRIAVGVAAVGVSVMTIAGGRLPWIALTLAVTFAIYGLLKKQAGAGPPIEGLLTEVGTATLPLGIYLAWLLVQDQSTAAAAPETWPLLPFTGVITVVPLLLFGFAAQRIPLSTVGMLQYLAPTLQFGIGVWMYDEALSGPQVFGFVTIWIALALFALDNWRATRPSPATSRA